MKPIVIRFNNKTSKKDIDDLKVLLCDIRERYNFDWFVDTYAKELKAEDKMEVGK